ncbi:unnamed protein product [Soboliphyme baturini]|uniref:Secreted protein n=1 Tax=Soboliphyme baturini TaxID=241478 RepID=A0A183IPC3_9BILA|nr:unnamed protein product [Soboliphyme baturini]
MAVKALVICLYNEVVAVRFRSVDNRKVRPPCGGGTTPFFSTACRSGAGSFGQDFNASFFVHSPSERTNERQP